MRELRLDDVAACATVHIAAFPQHFLSKLGTPFLKEFYRGFLDDARAVAVVAVDCDSGAVVGVLVGSTSPSGFFGRLVRRRLLGFVRVSASAALRRPTVVPRLLGAIRYRGQVPVPVRGALLSSICVDPAYQSIGVGRRLLERFRELIGEAGLGAYLTTDRDENDSANIFYIRNGWCLCGTFQTRQGRRMNCYVLPPPGDEGEG